MDTMSRSITRALLGLAYDQVGQILFWGVLRSVPWLLPGLILTFLSPDVLPGNWHMILIVSLVLLAALTAPLLTAGVYHQMILLARGENIQKLPPLLTRHYPILLLVDFCQLFLLLGIVQGIRFHLVLPPDERSFTTLMAIASGAWLLIIIRVWNFHFLPLLLSRLEKVRATASLTLILLLEEPGRTLRFLVQRQLWSVMLLFSGLGLLLALGSVLPMHASLATREALRGRALELAPPGKPRREVSLPGSEGLGKLIRPWEQ
jgi:hypothetical protein